MRAAVLTGLGAALAGALPVAAQVLGPDAAACAARTGSALLVRIDNIKRREGSLRVSTYRATEEEWLARGKYVRRIDVPVPASGIAQVCVALPAAGSYGVGVLHDLNADGKLNPFKERYGVSNNPGLGLSKPKVEKVAFAAGPGVTTIDIRLK